MLRKKKDTKKASTGVQFTRGDYEVFLNILRSHKEAIEIQGDLIGKLTERIGTLESYINNSIYNINSYNSGFRKYGDRHSFFED